MRYCQSSILSIEVLRTSEGNARGRTILLSRPRASPTTEGIRKLDGNAKGDCREEDQRTSRKITGGCRSMR
ncbi:hypothetical protein GW17_00054857, partial [Ensete ventricosum]